MPGWRQNRLCCRVLAGGQEKLWTERTVVGCDHCSWITIPPLSTHCSTAAPWSPCVLCRIGISIFQQLTISVVGCIVIGFNFQCLLSRVYNSVQEYENCSTDIDVQIYIYRVIKKIGPNLTNVYCTSIFQNIIID